MKVALSKVKSSYLHITQTTTLESDLILRSLGGKKTPLGGFLLPKIRASYYRLQEIASDLLQVTPDVVRKLFPDPGNVEIDHPNWNSLYFFQREAILSALSSKLPGQLISLSPGLGKTIVTILLADIWESKRILVVAPLILLPTWEREIEKWSQYDREIQIQRGEPLVARSGWVITNFEQIVYHKERFKDNWDLIVIDESIKVKSRHAARTKYLQRIALNSKKRLLLSGIPQTSDVSDLWSQFRIIDHTLFPSFWRFAAQYCNVVRGIWGDEILGSKRGIDFREEFSDLMFVRKSDEVLGLPEMIVRQIDLEFPDGRQKKVYKAAEEEFRLLLSSDQELPIPTRLVQMNRLQQILSNLANTDSGDGSIKLDALHSLIDEGEIEFPLLIWGFWTRGLRSLYQSLIDGGYKVGLIIGDTPGADREDLLLRYKTGGIDILIMGYGVGKYGLTLTNTKTVLPYDKVFGLDDIAQSAYRTQRIGLDHSVTLISLNVKGTIDDYITDSLQDKIFDLDRLGAGDTNVLLSFIGRNSERA